MSYYRECRNANKLIELLIMKASGKITVNDIVYAVTDKYEIGRGTVIKRINLLKEMTKISIENGKIHWLDEIEDNGKQS